MNNAHHVIGALGLKETEAVQFGGPSRWARYESELGLGEQSNGKNGLRHKLQH